MFNICCIILYCFVTGLMQRIYVAIAEGDDEYNSLILFMSVFWPLSLPLFLGWTLAEYVFYGPKKETTDSKNHSNDA